MHRTIKILFVVWVACSISLLAEAADWTYDFEGPAPPTWGTGSNTEPPGGASGTFSATISGGYLRLSDPTDAASGGSFSAFGGTEDVFTGVVAGADINVAMDTDDDLGVVVRADLAAGSAYFASLDYELGRACITKIADFSNGADLACVDLGLAGSTDSHRIELSAMGSNPTELSLSVFDASDVELGSVSATDDGSSLGAPYSVGIAGVFLVPKGPTIAIASGNTLNGTFDNAFARSVPEPHAGLLMLVACAGLSLFRGRRN